MKIIFVRHGETKLKTGTLTRRGIKQIKQSANYLKNEKIDAIFCSPKVRAIQTANIFKNILDVEVYIEKDLNERQILTPSQRELYGEAFDENYLNYNFQSEEFETCKDFIDRNFNGFINIISTVSPKIFRHIENPQELFKRGAYNVCGKLNSGLVVTPNSTIMIVAHSSTLYALNAFLNGIQQNGRINWLQCNNGAVIKFCI